MIAFYLLLTSCNEKQDLDTEEDTEEAEEAEETEEETEETEEETEETEEETEEEEVFSIVCSPQTNDQTANITLDLFDIAMTFTTQSCFLDEVNIDNESDGQIDSNISIDSPTELDCDDNNNCIQILPSFGAAWHQSSEYNLGFDLGYDDIYEGVVEGQRVITDGIETIELTLQLHSSSSTATRDIERVYDLEGHLLHEAYHFNSALWFEVNNRWEDGLLVEQDMFDYINSNSSHVYLNWAYDNEDRMLESNHIDQYGNIRSASFTYDENGRLAGLTRELDGETFLTQNWTYEDDLLISRSNVFRSGLMSTTNADTAGVQSPMDYNSHWDQSLKTTMDDCSTPPLSLSHGYPDDETIYQLGWSKNDVPNQVGFAYNYNGYAWMYGDLSWFGHSGIATMYGLENSGNESEFQSTINYQEGIMTDETLTMTDPNGNTNAVIRTRTLENGRIVTDEVVSTLETPEGSENNTQILSFVYDQDGRLTTRVLYQNEIQTHQHTWAYNTDGHLIEHKISRIGSLESTEMQTLATFRQTITEDAAEYERIRERQNGGEGEWMEIDIDRRGTHSRGRFESSNLYFVVFDAEERMVVKGQGDPEVPNYYNSWTDNEMGLLETWETGEYEEIKTRNYNYTCD